MILRRQTIIPYFFLVLLATFFPGLALICQRGEYLIGDQCCPPCSPGSRVINGCTEWHGTSCLSCTPGTFMDTANALKECFVCATCDEGSGLRVKKECTIISDAVCEPLVGFYCVDLHGDGCLVAQRHKKCLPGQFISKNGTALTDSVCSVCSNGTFSDGTFTSCLPHTQCESLNLPLMKAGTPSADAECGEENSNTTPIVICVAFSSGLAATVGVAVGIKWKKKSKHENM